MTDTLEQVTHAIADKSKKRPFQRVIDMFLPDIERLINDGYTYKVIADELTSCGCKTADGGDLSYAHLGGALNRARRKVRAGKSPRWVAR